MSLKGPPSYASAGGRRPCASYVPIVGACPFSHCISESLSLPYALIVHQHTRAPPTPPPPSYTHTSECMSSAVSEDAAARGGRGGCALAAVPGLLSHRRLMACTTCCCICATRPVSPLCDKRPNRYAVYLPAWTVISIWPDADICTMPVHIRRTG